MNFYFTYLIIYLVIIIIIFSKICMNNSSIKLTLNWKILNKMKLILNYQLLNNA